MYDYFSFTAMGLGFIIIAVYSYFFLVILNRARSVRHQGVDISPFLAQAMIFFFAALIMLFSIYNEAHILIEGSESIGFYTGRAISGYLFFISFIFVTEKILKRTHYVLTIFCLIMSFIGGFIFCLIMGYTVEQLRLYTTITVPILSLILVATYLIILVLKTKGNVRGKMELALLALILGLLFFSLDTIAGTTFFLIPKEITALISRGGILLSGLFIGYIFVSFESFVELDWPKNLNHLFIIARNGVNLFDYSFVHAENEPDPDIITASLSGIKELMASIIRSKNFVRVVDHQDLKLIFAYGEYATLVLIATENLHIYHQKLAHLMQLFEDSFQNTLPNWDGKLDIFLPTKQLIQQVFELKVDLKSGHGLTISPPIKRFSIIALLLLVVPVTLGFSVYFLNGISWQPLLSENWLLPTLSISAITLAVFLPLYLKFVLLHQVNYTPLKVIALTHKMFSLLLLCTCVTVLGFVIYILFSQVFWATLIWTIGLVDYFTLMLVGISLIERVDQMREP